jgi:DNA (cytosine-5)-methyltransferase 1
MTTAQHIVALAQRNDAPRALDLFCGAGGAAMGLHRAGFNVTGVDIVAQPDYPFDFVQGDAMTHPLDGFDFVWASPPCQRYSVASQCRVGLSETYPDLVSATRDRLLAWGGPFIIENVPRSPLRNPVMLCGAMFGLKSYRHRLFESNVALSTPPHPKHIAITSRAGHWRPGTQVSVAGNCAPIAMAREALGIPWMKRDGLRNAIPPVFAEFLARQIKATL